AGKYLMADAVMILLNRKLSPDVVISSADDSKKMDNVIPNGFMLENNFPNPFNPETTIRYNVSVETNVSLRVYDLLGREVETLFSGRQSSGNHEYKFEGKNLSSGVYFYQLKAGNTVQTKKMMLIK
ncbi:MAG: T9SS type A sorting domain-containing protein, partial [Bacteroidota bacterium]|nr:T9SS type A sorting domain-containing protein [Bacteroidota bacterium]